jgi:glycosyltransferase involved in cell wall biosynthesis
MSRIAVYTDYRYRRSGDRVYAERAFALFLVELARHVEHMVIVGKVDPRDGESHYELPSGIGFVELPYYESLTESWQMLGAMARSIVRFWRVLAQVDAVWLLGPHPLALPFAALAAMRGKSITLGVRQDFPRYVRARHPGKRWILLAGDLLEGIWRTLARIVGVVTVGPELAAMYPGAKRLEMVVSLVTDDDIRSPQDRLPDYDGDELRALSVGRLEQEKNPLLLADIAAALAAQDPRWRLIVCGEGPLDGELRQRLSAFGVEDRVQLLGYVPHDRGLREIYRSSHVLLHVSWTEGLPQVLFEAFAARLPVVATAVGGVPAAADGAAVLIEPGDAPAAARAVESVARDPELRARLVAAGVNRVQAHTLDAEAGRVADFICDRRGR